MQEQRSDVQEQARALDARIVGGAMAGSALYGWVSSTAPTASAAAGA